jgi:mannosyltransferase
MSSTSSPAVAATGCFSKFSLGSAAGRSFPWAIAALAAITLVGLVLRLLNLGESLWLDELHTGWVIRDAWSDVAPRAHIGNQSPLWFYAVKGLVSLLGTSEFTLRLLSLLAGTALMPTGFWLVQRLTPRDDDRSGAVAAVGGLLVAALVAVDRHCIFYATEARPYACVQLAAVWQLAWFLQTVRQPTTISRLACIVLTALLFHLHYTALAVVLGELLVLVAYFLGTRQRVPYRPWRALFDLQIAVMLCLPGLPHLWQVFQRREMWQLVSSVATVATLGDMFSFAPLLLACAASALLLAAQRWLPQIGGLADSWRPVALVAVWFVVPLVTLWCLARFEVAPLLLRRYLMAFALGPPLLTGLLLARWPRPALALVAGIGLVFVATYQSQVVEQMRYDGRAVGDRNEDWRGALAYLRAERKKHPAFLLFDAGLVEDEHWRLINYTGLGGIGVDYRSRMREYLSFPLHSLYESGVEPDEVIPLSLYASLYSDDEAALLRPREYWLVRRGTGPEFRFLTPQLLITKFPSEDSQQFRGVWVSYHNGWEFFPPPSSKRQPN